MAALNASKLAHCNNDGKSDILHFLYSNQIKCVSQVSVDSNISVTITLPLVGFFVIIIVERKKIFAP